MKGILFVDDEKDILKAIQRLFFDQHYEVYCAQSGTEALEILGNHQIDLIVTGMRMPEMDGYTLLKTVKSQYPHILRIILSGYSDDSILLKSLKENVAKLYMYKPWNNSELLTIVKSLLETEEILAQQSLLTVINDLGTLPTLKSNYLKLIHMIDDSEDTNSVVKEIEKDQALTANILRIANSAYYNLRAISVFKAVTYLGVNNIRNIIQATAIVESFILDKKYHGYVNALWQHAYLTTAILTMMNKHFLKVRDFDMIFTAGLLHHIGIAGMMTLQKEPYLKYMEEIDVKQAFDILTSDEKKRFPFAHDLLGGYMLKWWDMPFPIVEAALYHENPLYEGIINKQIVFAVYIASAYAKLQLSGNEDSSQENDFTQEELHRMPAVFQALSIDQNIFESMLKEFLITHGGQQ